ncbi:tetraspanin 34a [Centropristis striata]|uniref:tetraspanin 34a n=1 Tax=Centropristis striata TaxID=184440 RepID=UPI0027DF9ADC|nr:tetraspanin 34a [Centropristis striata]
MCCSGFLKMMMFIFNGAIFLAGAGILGVGVWVKVDSGSLTGLLESADAPSELSVLANVSYLLIGVGAVLLVIGFLGCCGAVKESRCMLLTFFSIVLIIFIVEVAGVVLLFVFNDLSDQIVVALEQEVGKSLGEQFGRSDSEGFTSVWNTTMKEFQCCGAKNYTDFDGSPFNTENVNVYPQTCCNETITVGVCNEYEAERSHIAGCVGKLVQLIEENAVIIAAVVLAIAALEIAAMVVSMVLYKQIGNKA